MANQDIIIQVRTLAGASVRKSFAPSTPVLALYQWLNTEANPGKEQFLIQNSYPRTTLGDEVKGKTLAEIGLSKQATLVMIRPNAQQANKSTPIEGNKPGFFESLFGSKDEKKETEKAKPAAPAKSEPGFFEKLFGSDEPAEPRRTVKDARTLDDVDSDSGGSKDVESKKIKGMHSNIKGFK